MMTLLSKSLIIKYLVFICLLFVIAWWWFAESSDNSHQSNNKDKHSSGPFNIQVRLDPIQAKVGNNDLTIILTDKNNNPVTDAQIKAVAEMAAMGTMPAMPAPAKMTHTDSGIYQGTFELLMNGAWPLSLKITSASTGETQLEYDLTTSRAGLRLNTMSATQLSDTMSMSDNIDYGKISMDARRRQLIGVTTAKVQLKTLTKTIRAASRITYNETQLTDITLKYDGWIGKLHADYIGNYVQKQKPLFTVYSPELLSAQREYLEILRRTNNSQHGLLQAARQRLILWDITAAQISQLEKRNTAIEYLPILSPSNGIIVEKFIVTGSSAKAGQKLLQIADLSTVWVEANLYEYEIPLVKLGIKARIVLPEIAKLNLSGTVSYISPTIDHKTRTATVRVELDNSESILKPNMYANMILEINLGERLLVPETAVLYAGNSRVVFIDLGNGQLQARKITTGLRNDNDIEVIHGLKPGMRVVTSGNFLIAAESKLKAGIQQW